MSFAGRLRWWRERRGLSQLALAATAEVSQRHWSFLEVGRTAPSREMVLRLAATLDCPCASRTRCCVPPASHRCGARALGFLTDTAPAEADPSNPVNLADALADGTDETAALLERLLAYPGVPRISEAPSLDDLQGPVLPIHFAKGPHRCASSRRSPPWAPRRT